MVASSQRYSRSSLFDLLVLHCQREITDPKSAGKRNQAEATGVLQEPITEIDKKAKTVGGGAAGGALNSFDQ